MIAILKTFALSTAFALFFTAPVTAQSYVISPANLDDAAYSHVKVIGQDEEGFYLLQSNLSLATERDRIGFKNRKYKISYYDFNLKKKWDKALSAFEDGANVEAVTFFNNHILVLQSKYQRGENIVTFFSDIYNNTGKTDKYNVRLGECHYGKNNDLSKVKLVVSASKLMGAMYFEEETDNEIQVQAIVFDSSLKHVSQHKLLIPYEDKRILQTEYALSENGDFVTLAQLNDKNPENEKKRLLQYHLFVNRAGQSEFTEYALSSENKPMTEAALAIDNLNRNAVVVGFYVDRTSSSGAGISYTTLSLTNDDSLHLNSYAIKGDTQIKLIGERNEERMGLFNYPIQRIVLRADGGAMIMAEAIHTSSYTFYDYFTHSHVRRIEYHFDNIIVMSINGKGGVDWTHVMRKNQASVDDGGFLSSFISALSSDKMVVIYNNDISRNNEVTGYEVSATGELKSKKLISSNERIYILPRAGKQVDDETLIVPAIVKKRMYLVKIKI